MKRLIFLLLGVIPCLAQGAPDCKINFSFTATGRIPSAGFPNGTPSEPGCVTWTIVYYNTGFTPISIELDSAPDSSGAAGTWVQFAGTIVTGINPNTATTSNFTVFTGYFPWISVNLTTATGSGKIAGTAYGWKTPGFAYTSSSGGGGATNVNLQQVNGHTTQEGGTNGSLAVGGQVASGSADAGNPVKIGGSNGTNDYNLKVDSQGNNYGFLGCTNTAEVSLSGTGYVEIVAGTASQVIQVCKVFVTSVSGGNPTVNTFSIASATITTCAGPTELYNAGGITGMDSDWGGALRSAAGKSICVSETVANSDKVTISYQKAIF